MRRAQLALISLALILTGGALVYAAISENQSVGYGAELSLTGPDGVCRKITNNSSTGAQLYVPGASTAEWQSFIANPPAGVSLSSCVTPGSQTYSTQGTYAFTVPAYNTLTVQMWGGGSGGGSSPGGGSYLYSIQPSGGGASSFNGTVIAGGGGTATGWSPSTGGAGGVASGGDTNVNGGAGGNSVPNAYVGGGGSAPFGGAGGGPGQPLPFIAGGAGGIPGGGGGGVVICGRGVTGGGGAGAFAQKTYAVGALTPGASVSVIVGSGGAGLSGNGNWCYPPAGGGAPGQVIITWN